MANSEKGIDIIVGANLVLKYKKENRLVSEEEIMKHVLLFLKNKKLYSSKEEILIGVSKAIDIILRDNRKTDRQIITQITKELPNLLAKK